MEQETLLVSFSQKAEVLLHISGTSKPAGALQNKAPALASMEKWTFILLQVNSYQLCPQTINKYPASAPAQTRPVHVALTSFSPQAVTLLLNTCCSLSKGTSNNGQSTPDSALGRPSLAGRLLGKRKASAPPAEQPDTKRSTVEAPPDQPGDDEGPSCSHPDSPGPAQPQKSESQESEWAAGPSSSHIAFGLESSNDVIDFSGQQGEPESAEVSLLDDSDSLDEVIVCEAPPAPSSPKEKGEEPASPARANSSSGVPPGKSRSPVHPVHKSPVISNTQPASTSGPPSFFRSFPTAESKSASSVPCNYCPKILYMPAVKTCLVCGASMCPEHLRPHLDSPVFQDHTLIPPVKDISSWRCQEHQEMNRIYCRQCAVCVCTVCTVIGSHRGHMCISIREAEAELRVSTSVEAAKRD